jgi:glycosyltransferase involved in cell wall biosynthesis
MSFRPLKILQLNTVFNGGGTDNQSLELARGLQDLGHRVWLAVPPERHCEAAARRLDLRLAYVKPKGKVRQLRDLARLVRQNGIDLIHGHHGRDYWLAVIAALFRPRRVRVVLSRHLATLPSAASRALLLHGCDALVAVSQAVEEILRSGMKGSPAKIHRIYGGVDTASFASVAREAVEAFRGRMGWQPDQVVSGVVGSFSLPRGKGQLEFLEAAAGMKKEFPWARFALIGRGNMETLLRSRIQELSLSEIVRIIPFTDEIPVVMNALDILVHPAVGTEALGLVLWEAMACGKPILASRLGGIPEAFREGEHGLLVPPANVPALAEAMRELLRDPDKRARFGSAGCAHVCRNFSRARQAERFQELYSSLHLGQNRK